MSLTNNSDTDRPVSFEDTIIYAGEYASPESGDVQHVLAYRAQTLKSDR